jgi:hypothetical protein
MVDPKGLVAVLVNVGLAAMLVTGGGCSADKSPAAQGDIGGIGFDAGGFVSDAAGTANDGGRTPAVDGGASDAGNSVFTLTHDGTRAQKLVMGGVNILRSFYIIGSCTGADVPGENVISIGSNGAMLYAPGSCPGAPFKFLITVTGPQSFHASVSVGPMPVDYAGFSVPFDTYKDKFTTLRTSASSYEVGCGNSWDVRNGGGSPFSEIPTPCFIPAAGPVGAARFVPLPTWGEISGPMGTVRRTRVSGGSELLFYNHPDTNNIEVALQPSNTRVAAGATLKLEEDFLLTPPAGGFPSRAKVLLPLVYRAVLNREPDPSGLASFSPPIDATGATGMESVAAGLFTSAEFTTLRATLSTAGVVDQFFRGILGRAGGAAALPVFGPLVEGGRYGEFIQGLVRSTEFRDLYPLAYY